jgi:hypothetical protein
MNFNDKLDENGSVEELRTAFKNLIQTYGRHELNFNTASVVVLWLKTRGKFYHHSEELEFEKVLFFNSEKKVLQRVQSASFQAWLSEITQINRKEGRFAFILKAIENEGLNNGSPILPSAYWSSKIEGDTVQAIYLSNGDGIIVRIRPNSVDEVDNGTDGVLFPVGLTLKPWKMDFKNQTDPFDQCAIFRAMENATPHCGELLRLWTCAVLGNFPCRPPLCITSPVGGGKTALIRGLQRLLGVPETVVAATQKGEEDFWVTLDQGGLACLDNADTRIDWLADTLSLAATGGTRQKRKLYTDGESVKLRPRAAVAITSASPNFAADPGLADRLIVVRLERRIGQTQESWLFAEVDAARDAGLSWIANRLADALADTAPTPNVNKRHPDFAALAVRIGRAMGHETAAVAALQAAETDKSRFNVENDPVGVMLLDAITEPFSGTAADLVGLFAKGQPEGARDVPSPKSLGKRLDAIWPHLETFFAARKRKGHGGTIVYSFAPPKS